jgi:hypothetical protein
MAGPYNFKTLMMAATAYIDDSCSEVIDSPKSEVLDVVELPGDHTSTLKNRKWWCLAVCANFWNVQSV